MGLTLDSPMKRTIFIIIAAIISLVFVVAGFFYQPNLHQHFVIVYLVIIQILVLLTFFAYRNSTTGRAFYVKKLKNPRLQENAFSFARLLLKEFDYIRDTAAQAMNDRHTMVNFFLIITGVFLSAIASRFFSAADIFSDAKYISIMIAGAIIINFVGWIYFMHIIRLRQAWYDSAAAMNQIKEFFIVNGRIPDELARSALLWDMKTIPSPGKKGNVFYYSAVLISFISAVVLLLASWLLSPHSKADSIGWFSCLLALYHFLFQMFCYSLFLDYKPIK
ncbi:MAG: hypothetical protein ONB33_08445 [candidate division KSB1 bacterium]|nr:hypothetical protein [candidate division KSB1 bacterium]